MWYAIDFDSRLVESKSETKKPLSKYIVENNFELAIALINNENELALQFSINELNDLAANYNVKLKTNDIEEISKICFEAIKNNNKIPMFSKKLKNKIIKKYKPKLETIKKPKLSKTLNRMCRHV